jgi:hypothetical protein
MLPARFASPPAGAKWCNSSDPSEKSGLRNLSISVAALRHVKGSRDVMRQVTVVDTPSVTNVQTS